VKAPDLETMTRAGTVSAQTSY